MNTSPADRAAVEMLAADLLRAIVTHYHRRPATRATAQEVLNALGSAAALVIHGAETVEGRAEARAFFDLALDQQLADLRGRQDLDAPAVRQ